MPRHENENMVARGLQVDDLLTYWQAASDAMYAANDAEVRFNKARVEIEKRYPLTMWFIRTRNEVGGRWYLPG
jgi:hypothetical protein